MPKTSGMRHAFLILALVSVVLGAEFNPLRPIPSLALADGRTLRNVQIVSFASTAVMARWEGGRGTIAYDNLPKELADALAAFRPAASKTDARPPTGASAEPKPQPVAKADVSQPAAVQPAKEDGATITVAGEVFLSGGTNAGVRGKFAGIPVIAYPLEEAVAAFQSYSTPVLPEPLMSSQTDSEGRFSIKVPKGRAFLLYAKGTYFAPMTHRSTEWEWRVKSTDQSDLEHIMLTDRNAQSVTPMQLIRR